MQRASRPALVTAALLALLVIFGVLLPFQVISLGQRSTGPILLPFIASAGLPPSNPSAEWSQYAFNAQRTSFYPNAVPAPWRWKWAWNGPDAAGGIAAGKFGLPRTSQPVTGGGRVYVAAGSRGVYALDNANGAPVWNRNPGGSINSTPAYDADTRALFVVSSNGTLYKLDAADGRTLGSFAASGNSTLPLPPAISGDRVFFSMGAAVYAVNKTTMQQIWRYDAGSPVDTPPAYSATRNLVVVASRDLFVHGIRNADGGRAWRTKTAAHVPGDPMTLGDNDFAAVSYGWPVIAEQNGVVFIKLQLDTESIWTWSPWPGSNAEMRRNLLSKPTDQALLALRLDTGATAFIPNVGNGGFGDGDYLPMGPLPVISRLSDGSEVAYVMMRGSPCKQNPCDGRWDSHFGEMMLNDATVPGYRSGEVRFMEGTFIPTDEQPYLTMAGNQLFAGHWEVGIAHTITDRSPSRGVNTNPIRVANLPHIATSQDNDECGTGFNTSHYCDRSLYNTRIWPAGFYIYWRQGNVYDRYWSEYASWVISNNMLYVVSTDGAVVALEPGQPRGVSVPGATGQDATIAEARASQEVIDHTLARAYAGRTVTVEGVLREVFNNGKAVYLGYHAPHRGHFLVRILKEDWPNFERSPEQLYAPGQRVQVTGRIEWYQGDPVIYVRNPAQIRVVGAPSAAAPRP